MQPNWMLFYKIKMSCLNDIAYTGGIIWRRDFDMESLCSLQKNKAFLLEFSKRFTQFHHQQRMTYKVKKYAKGWRRGWEGEEGQEKEERARERSREDPIKGGPPPARTSQPTSGDIQRMKNRVPLRCLNIGAIIFIEAMSRTAVVAFDFQGLPNLKVICKPFLVFPAHGFKHCGIVPIDQSSAVPECCQLPFSAAFLCSLQRWSMALMVWPTYTAFLLQGQLSW